MIPHINSDLHMHRNVRAGRPETLRGKALPVLFARNLPNQQKQGVLKSFSASGLVEVQPGSAVRRSATGSARVVKDDARSVPAPDRIGLTPWRSAERSKLCLPRTGLWLTANATPSPRLSGTTEARDCMCGRCSISMNSPPSKSSPGSDSKIATCRGNTAPRRGPDAGSCSRRGHSAAAAVLGGSGPPRGSARESPRDRWGNVRRSPLPRSSGWQSGQDAGKAHHADRRPDQEADRRSTSTPLARTHAAP